MFSCLIKAIRRKSLHNQSKFVINLGVSFLSLNRWENEKAVLKLCKLKLINDFCVTLNAQPPYNDIYVSKSDNIGTE